MRFLKHTSIFLLLLSCTIARTQPAQPAATNVDCLKGAVKDLKPILAAPASDDKAIDAKKGKIARVLSRWPVYVCYMADNDVRAALMGVAEQKRQDKQPGSSNSASGSTSLVNKGSSPWLFGFALEHGGLTQSTDGNTITFRGNVANSIRALLKSSYLGSYQLGEKDPLVQYLAKLSFGVSFDTTADQGSTTSGFTPNSSNLSGFSAKYEFINHRDPRDKRWRSKWHDLSTTVGMDFTNALGELSDVLKSTALFADWRDEGVKALIALPSDASDDKILPVLQDRANSFVATFGNSAEVNNAVTRLTSSISNYIERENNVFSEIRNTPLLTLEYNFVRQSLPANQNVTSVQPAQSIPDLSTLTLVLERGFKGVNAPELTLNAESTWFNSSVAGNPGAGRLRDYRASGQLDVPLKTIQNVGQPTLSFAGQFLALVEEPLGQKVMLNGVTIDRRGNIGVFQTKLSIPVKDSGLKIPISFTYASRTELIKENDVRGNVGITLDLDSLFSKAK
jgi:hypothetical protein